MNKTTQSLHPSTWTITLCAALLCANAQAQTTPAATAAAPVALSIKINGQTSPAERGELLLREQLARGVADSPQLRNVIRETLINQAVMAQDATKQSLDKQPQNKARLELAQQNALAQIWQQKAMQDAVVSDADLKAEYQAQVKALGTQEFQLRHVLLADEKTAQQVLDKIKAGAKFETVALESSRDPGTRDKGGLSDWVAEARLSPAILQAVQALKNGQLAAQPVQTPAGWQVIKLEDKRALTPPPLESVTPQLKTALAQKQVQAKLAALRAAAKVE
ncbi:MAG: peptidylprolyl isomerase [Comamonadaceae bacterium PBBC2]|nr:MAG: peptidylprolyl isomerase [Comamonadaceae bacterium PBBC2]